MAAENPENHYALVTTIGTDRPGIVQDVSEWILQEGGNIEDSRMSLLGGEFATLILVSGDSAIARRLEASREAFQARTELTVFTKSVRPRAAEGTEPALRYELNATALDQSGIVHHVALILREQAINIVSATTRTSPAPFTGAPIFQFEMVIDIPASVSMRKLRAQLEELGDRENIDFVLTAAV